MSFQGYSQNGTEPSPKQEDTPAQTWFHGELQRPGQRRWQPSTSEEEDPKEAAESVCSDVQKLGPIRSNNYIWWREKQSNVSSKTVLSGQEEEGTYNRFSCFVVHSKMSQSTNAKSKPLEGLYTDTDPDDRSEIITDVTIRMPGKAGTMMMEVKVDPGAQPSCIPLHKFKTLFPHLCRDGLPKEGLLDNTQNEFQSYNGWRHDMLWAPANRCQGQGHQEVSSHQILRDEHRRTKNIDQPCSIILVRFVKGAM